MKERPWESVEGEKRAQQRTQRSPKASRRGRERILERDREKVPPGDRRETRTMRHHSRQRKARFKSVVVNKAQCCQETK